MAATALLSNSLSMSLTLSVPVIAVCGADNGVGVEVVMAGTSLTMALGVSSEARVDRVLIWVTVSSGNENRPRRKISLHVANDTSGVTILAEQACWCSSSV